MEMVSISKADYDEFLAWKGGAIGTPKPSKTPEGGWRYYREGLNPWASDTLNISAQDELCRHDINLAVKLAERVNSPMAATLKGMQKAQLLERNGF